jgi:hypothetical protein
MELFKASEQWSKRPADERFWNLEEMLATCEGYRASAVEANVRYGELRAVADNGEVMVTGKKNVPARLTHWSFGQLAQRAGAPAGYLRALPATLAVQNLNHGLSRIDRADDEIAKVLFHKNGDYVMRAATGPAYSRVWNADIVRRLIEVTPKGWQVPPARPAGVEGERVRKAAAGDVLRLKKAGLSIEVGDDIAPAGLYASDHDMFAFLVNEDAAVNDGTGHALGRGFFVWNSEVGAASFGIMTFLYDAICGNHIVWGARGVSEIRVKHVGEANSKAFSGIRAELIKYADDSVSDLEAKIRRARSFEFGATKEEALEGALKFATKTRTLLNYKALDAAYDIAEQAERYGSPRSAWGLVNGLTELSQKSKHADERVKLDRAAGKIMEIDF